MSCVILKLYLNKKQFIIQFLRFGHSFCVVGALDI